MSFLWSAVDCYKLGRAYDVDSSTVDEQVICVPIFFLAHATAEEYTAFWNEQREMRGLPKGPSMPPGVYYRVSLD